MNGWSEEAVGTLLRNMELPETRYQPDVGLCLEMERRGKLYLEQKDEGLLIYLAREVSVHIGDLATRALSECHFRSGLPFELQVGLRGEDQLVLLTHVPRQHCTSTVLEAALALLTRMQVRLLDQV